MAFEGGYALNSWIRFGLELNGWLLQAYNLRDPTVGESFSQALAVTRIYPVKKSGFFFKGGVGSAFYTNYRPGQHGGNGLGMSAGAGYDIPLKHQFRITPAFHYSSGWVGDVHGDPAYPTNRRFSVVDVRIGITFR